MDIDDERLRDLDRAQLMKLGAAALLAAVAGGAVEGEADAAAMSGAHSMTHNIIPIGLDYQTRGYGKMQKTRARMGKELKRVRITSDKSKTAGATIVHQLEEPEVLGTDELGRAHNKEFGSAPMFVALWIE